ncbi:hypothetical protein [Flavobacterium psychroterrae]|nr:hypothetical protein [Flavobacterium psychroterrae]
MVDWDSPAFLCIRPTETPKSGNGSGDGKFSLGNFSHLRMFIRT